MIVLIDSDESSLTISWPEVKGARRYVLEYAVSSSSGKLEYQKLSDKLTTTQVRKRNLDPKDGPFKFRVRPRDEIDFLGDYITSENFQLLERCGDRMDAPQVSSAGGNSSVLIEWKKFDTSVNVKYEIQIREDIGGDPWQTIGTVSGLSVRKKNLNAKSSYQFRVRPIVGDHEEGKNMPFSAASIVVKVFDISPGMASLFRGLSQDMLLSQNRQKVSLSNAVANKIVLFYVSAHWCGPCRQFTPQLARFYEENKKDVEIVFLSADHDAESFVEYFKSMPWKAVPYDDDLRESLQARYRVSAIPRLIVVNKNGTTIVENAVGKPMDVTQWKKML